MAIQIAVDASALLAELLPDEVPNRSASLYEYLDRRATFLSSPMLPFEIANVLHIALQRGRITSTQLNKTWKFFRSLPISYDEEVAWSAIFSLADEYQLSMYDASYLWVATEHEIDLLTEDTALYKVVKNL